MRRDIKFNFINSPPSGSNSQPGLDCLADVGPDERPPYSNFTLVKYAILGSPNQKLTLAEIYDAIIKRFPWFNTAGKGWKVPDLSLTNVNLTLILSIPELYPALSFTRYSVL